ncbi:MerR family transcriptional regulator [Euzebya tangerina]|uniref:MerR family transcriptional regulator n=1 Tax=Euzebya tangerina TaxID=591198 RepID=UPI000E32291D|nr:MerR family transcriptional regulator [Euzebya tangerina]
MGQLLADTPATYTISEAGARTGVSADTLRYYEKAGIMPPVRRDAGGRRQYSSDDLGWITFVRRLRATGMSMQRIEEYTAMVRAGEGTIADRRRHLEEHRETVIAAIEELTEAVAVLDRKIEHYVAAEEGRDISCSVEPLKHVGELA